MKNKLPVSDEIHELFCECHGAIKCRDFAIKSFFHAERAIYYAGKAEKLRTKAWRKVFALYPQTKNGKWLYDMEFQWVYQEEA